MKKKVNVKKVNVKTDLLWFASNETIVKKLKEDLTDMKVSDTLTVSLKG